jgi:hypothetical protein
LDKDKRQYLLHWKDPWNEFKDTLVLSEDGNNLRGTNNIGSVIEGKRVRPLKAPAPQSAEEREKLKAAALRALEVLEARKGAEAASDKNLEKRDGDQSPPEH